MPLGTGIGGALFGLLGILSAAVLGGIGGAFSGSVTEPSKKLYFFAISPAEAATRQRRG